MKCGDNVFRLATGHPQAHYIRPTLFEAHLTFFFSINFYLFHFNYQKLAPAEHTNSELPLFPLNNH